MKNLLVAFAGAVWTAPATILACDSTGKCLQCKVNDASNQVVEMLPGFFSSHAGLLLAVGASAVVFGLSLSRQARVVSRA